MINLKIKPISESTDGAAFVDVDLFGDESIEMELDVRSSQDVGSVFSDFSNEFNVPATANNTALFRHFYRTDVTDGAGYTTNIPATILIDGLVFRTGSINLLKAHIRDGELDFYTVQFFSDLQKLNDSGKLQLSELDFTAYDHDFSSDNIISGLGGGLFGTDLFYPLATQQRNWDYNVIGNITDRNLHYLSPTGTNGANYYEFKPAISFKAITEAISDALGYTFTGDFYDTNSPLDTTYMWLHGSEGYLNKENRSLLGQHTRLILNGDVDIGNDRWFNITTQNGGRSFVRGGERKLGQLKLNFTLPVTSTPNPYYNIVFYLKKGSDGTVVDTDYVLWKSGGSSNKIDVELIDPNSSSGDLYYIEYLSPYTNDPIVVTEITAYTNFYTGFVDVYRWDNCTVKWVETLIVSNLMPEMTCVEFLDAIIKMFNLTLTYEGEDSFGLQAISSFGAGGEVIDVTDFLNTESVTIEQANKYSSYNLRYSDSEQYRSAQFNNFYQRQYGEYRRTNNSSNSESKDIEIPFEIPYMELFVDVAEEGIKFPVYKSLKDVVRNSDESNSYFGKYVVFQSSGETIPLRVGGEISILDEAGASKKLDTLVYFGLFDTLVDPTFSLAFSRDYSYHPSGEIIFGGGGRTVEVEVYENLYTNYWEGYLNKIDSPYARLISFNGRMNIKKLPNFSFENIVSAAGILYLIDSVSINLNTGEFDIKLLNN